MKKDKYSKHTMAASTNLVTIILQQYSLKVLYDRLNYLLVVAIRYLSLHLQILKLQEFLQQQKAKSVKLLKIFLFFLNIDNRSNTFSNQFNLEIMIIIIYTQNQKNNV